MKDLNTLRKEAKYWLKQVRGNNPGHIKRLRIAYPRAPAALALRDVQHALAREHGYESWKTLAAALDERPASVTPSTGGDPVSNFLGFACWDQFVHGRGDPIVFPHNPNWRR